MNNVTLKQLRYFEALARHKHFGRAADASAISQPALSMRIKELEASLGTALFERGPRQVSLTTFGEEFAPRARDILRAVDELGDMARAATTELSGRLRIGVIPTIAPYLLPKLIGDLTQAHPQVDMQIRETVTPRLLDELQDGLLDTAILALPIAEPTLVETPLFEEAMMLVRPKAEADAPVPAKDQLREMRLLLLEEGHCFRDQALSYCDMAAQQPRAGLDGSSLSTLVQMVGAGIGVTLIPEMAVEVETRSAPVCVGHFAGVPPKRTVGMVWRKTHPLATQLTEVATIVKGAAARLIDGVGAD